MTGINYNKWAFHFMIWIIIIFIVQFFMTINFNSLTQDAVRFSEVMLYFGLIMFLLFLATVILLIFSTVKKQTRNYQFWIAFCGCIFYIIQFVLAFTLTSI